jgi:hypothetical protein
MLRFLPAFIRSHTTGLFSSDITAMNIKKPCKGKKCKKNVSPPAPAEKKPIVGVSAGGRPPAGGPPAGMTKPPAGGGPPGAIPPPPTSSPSTDSTGLSSCKAAFTGSQCSGSSSNYISRSGLKYTSTTGIFSGTMTTNQVNICTLVACIDQITM